MTIERYIFIQRRGHDHPGQNCPMHMLMNLHFLGKTRLHDVRASYIGVNMQDGIG